MRVRKEIPVRYAISILILTLLMSSAALSQSEKDADGSFLTMDDSVRIFTFSQGEGEKVLFVHGGPGYPHAGPIDAFESIADRYKIVYYDQRGCGRSDRPIKSFDGGDFMQNTRKLTRYLGLRRQIEDIEQIRKVFGVEKITLIGHSFGGFISAMYAKDYPENVNAIVFVAPANMLKFPVEDDLFSIIRDMLPDSMLPSFDDLLARTFDFSNIYGNTDDDLMKLNSEIVPFYAYAAEEMGFSMPSGYDPAIAGGWMVQGIYLSMGMSYDHTTAMKFVSAPVLVLHGDRDLQSEGASRTYSNSFPNASFEIVRVAGHFMFVDEPDRFASFVGSFLDSVYSANPER